MHRAENARAHRARAIGNGLGLPEVDPGSASPENVARTDRIDRASGMQGDGATLVEQKGQVGDIRFWWG